MSSAAIPQMSVVQTTKMRAIVRKQFGAPEQLEIQEMPIAKPTPGQVVIEVKVFGLNPAETYMRKGDWGDVVTPSGIECVGLVKADLDGPFAPGAAAGVYEARPAHGFRFDQIQGAHRLMESNQAKGKVVVTLNSQ